MSTLIKRSIVYCISRVPTLILPVPPPLLRAGLLSRTTAGKSSAPFLSITCTHAHTNDVRSITCNLPFNYMHAFTHLHRQTTDMHARHLARSRTCTGRFVFRSQDMHQCGSLCHVAHTTLHQNDYTHKPVSDIVNHTAQMHTHPNDPSRNSPSHTCKEVGCELGVPAQAHWNWVWVSFDNLPQTKINHFDLMI